VQIFYGTENFNSVTSSVVTVGTFDGVHLGHKKVLNLLKSEAYTNGFNSVVVTFSAHPRIVLKQNITNLKFLSTIDEKINLLKKYGIDQLIIIPFDKDFADLQANQFISKYLKNIINANTIIVGYDHHIGKGREADSDAITKAASAEGIKVLTIIPEYIEGEAVSSTRIRNALATGNIKLANICLGYKYNFNGKVVEGNKLGSTIDFPTANLLPTDNMKLIPAKGVYAVNVKVNGVIYKAMMNIGFRPTINNKNKINKIIEVHIFNFNKYIYNDIICVYIVDKIRDEKKFDSLNALKDQLVIDKITALNILSI